MRHVALLLSIAAVLTLGGCTFVFPVLSSGANRLERGPLSKPVAPSDIRPGANVWLKHSVMGNIEGRWGGCEPSCHVPGALYLVRTIGGVPLRLPASTVLDLRETPARISVTGAVLVGALVDAWIVYKALQWAQTPLQGD